jgi:hypothetical protein
MVSALKIILLLCIIILPLRGPRKRREQGHEKPAEKEYSEYVITEDGNLDFAKKQTPQ